MRILSVEDEESTAMLERLLLKRELGASVDTAPDCASARELLSESSYDLIMLDYQLPDGDGLTLLEEIAGSEGHPPVIMVTGHGDESTAVSAFKLGASGYVVKDARMSTMLIEEARSALARAGQAKSEEALRRSEERLAEANAIMASVLEHHMMAVYMDTRFNFIWVNPAYARTCGHDRSYFPGKNHFDLYPHVENEAIFRRVVDTGEPFHVAARPFEFPDQPERGVTYWDWSLVPVKDADGAVAGLVFTLADVTDRARAVQALGQSEEKYRMLFESSIDGIVFVNMEGSIVSENQAYRDMLGYAHDELAELTYVQLTPEKYHEIEAEMVRTQILTRGYSDLYKKEYIRKDGTVFPVSLRTWLVKDGEENPTGMWAIVRDVTERKRAEEAVRESEALYRTIFNSTGTTIVIAEEDTTLAIVNDEAENLLGLPRSEIEGRSWTEFIYPDDIGWMKAYNSRRTDEPGDVPSSYETRFVDGDGNIKHVMMTVAMIPGTRLRVASIMDVTERKRSEEALHKERAFIEDALDAIPDAFIVYDLEGNPVRWNRAFDELTGYSDEEISWMAASDFHPGKTPGSSQKRLGMLFKQGNPMYMETRVLNKDGRAIPCRLSGSLLRNTHGEPIAICCVGRDITERKLAEDQARYLSSITENISDALMVTDVDFAITYMNRASEELFGYKLRELEGKTPEIFNADSMSRQIQGELYEYVSSGKSYVGESLNKRKDGSTFVCEYKVMPVLNDDGRISAYVGIQRDITDRKAADDAIRASEEKYRSLFTMMLDGFALHEIVTDEKGSPVDYVFLEANSAFESMTGLKAHEIIGKRVTEVLPGIEKDPAGWIGRYGKVALGDEEIRFESFSEALGRWYSVYAYSPRERFFATVFEDITEGKAAEEALRRANAELSGYAHTVSHDIKAPLSTVAAAADILSSILEAEGGVALEGDAGDALRIIGESNRRALALTDDLLALAQAGRAQETTGPVVISEVVRLVLGEKEEQLEERGVRMSVDDDLGVAAMDPTHAYQVFSNLIGNAIDHNDSDNPGISVSRPGEAGAGRLRYLVRDNGPGIPVQLLETLFTPFVKGEGGGTGIGLSIVEKVVRLYGGEVRACNDGGACFEFTLPGHSSQGP